VILGADGTEQLLPRQLLTVMNHLLRGVVFAPAMSLPAAWPVTPHSAPSWWLEAAITPALTSQPQQPETEQ